MEEHYPALPLVRKTPVEKSRKLMRKTMPVPSKLFDLWMISRECHADGHDLLSNKDRMKKRKKAVLF